MQDRLERLGGEPAPVITPDEFARLQQAGQVHIDSRGRVRTTRRSDTEAGVSLRKRRAWYGNRYDEARRLREAMVAGLKERGELADPRLEEAFLAIPRHLFLPDVPLDAGLYR